MAGDSCKPVVGLVLARGGSMKIPMKNLAPIGCDSLLSRCLKTMKIAKCKCLFYLILMVTSSKQI